MGFRLRTCCWLAGIVNIKWQLFFLEMTQMTNILRCKHSLSRKEHVNMSIGQVMFKNKNDVFARLPSLETHHLIKDSTQDWTRCVVSLRCPTHRANYTPGHLFPHLRVGPMNQQAMVASCDNKITSKISSPRNTGTNSCQLYMPYVLSKGTMAWWWTKNEALFPKKHVYDGRPLSLYII